LNFNRSRRRRLIRGRKSVYVRLLLFSREKIVVSNGKKSPSFQDTSVNVPEQKKIESKGERK